MVMRSDLPADVKQRIQAFFVNYGTGADAERQQKVLAGLTYKGFRASSNAQLVPIRQMALAKQNIGVETDTTLSAADRKQNLAELDRQQIGRASCRDRGRQYG